MCDDSSTSLSSSHCLWDNMLTLGPWKNCAYNTSSQFLPLQMPFWSPHLTWPVGWTVHVLCNVQAIMTNGLLQLGKLADEPKESFTAQWDIYTSHLVISNVIIVVPCFNRQRCRHLVFNTFLQMIPGLKELILIGKQPKVIEIAEMVPFTPCSYQHHFSLLPLTFCYKRELLVLDMMTQKA